MSILFIISDPPYGTERCYNAVRSAGALLKRDPATEVTVFLMADAVGAARRGQKVPEGYYSLRSHAEARRRGQGAGLAVRDLHECPWDDQGRPHGRSATE